MGLEGYFEPPARNKRTTIMQYTSLWFILDIDSIAFLSEEAAIDFDRECNPELYGTKEQSFQRQEDVVYSRDLDELRFILFDEIRG